MIENPPLKLVLFENRDAEPGSINHLGVEADTAHEVVANETRLRAAGLPTTGIDDTICCFAEKVETWVDGPAGHRWEWYVKQADHDGQLTTVIVSHRETAIGQDASPCCTTDSTETVSSTACCAG